MPRPFIVIGESATGMADLNDCLLELDELVRTARCAIPRKLSGQCGVATFSKNRIERILREHVLDVGDKQFLVLLFMMYAQDDDRLDFIEQLFVSVGKQIVDVRIDRDAIALCLPYSWPRN